MLIEVRKECQVMKVYLGDHQSNKQPRRKELRPDKIALRRVKKVTLSRCAAGDVMAAGLCRAKLRVPLDTTGMNEARFGGWWKASVFFVVREFVWKFNFVAHLLSAS